MGNGSRCGDQIKHNSVFAKVACIILNVKIYRALDTRAQYVTIGHAVSILVEIRIQSLRQSKYLFNNYKYFPWLSEP